MTAAAVQSAAAYAPLNTHSGFSLLDSACRVSDLVATAARHGCPALALTDRDSVAGAVQFCAACRAAGIQPVLGADLTLADNSVLTLLCLSDTGWSNLCRLLSRHSRHNAAPDDETLFRHAEGLLALSGPALGRIPSLLARGQTASAIEEARRFAAAFSGRFYIALFQHTPAGVTLKNRLLTLAENLAIPAVPAQPVHYINPGDFRLWQAVASVRTLTLLDQPHPAKPQPGAYHFHTPAEMARLFGAGALPATIAAANRCQFSF